MLYGPNTNLGHNSIVYMLESQIAHVMRCLRTMRRDGAREIDVDARRYRRFNVHVQQRLEGSVWNSCKSWYVDASGHNSTNWPGFTLTYRWITRFTGMGAYRFTHPLPESAAPARDVVVAPPVGRLEATAASLRGFLRVAFRPLIGPPFGARINAASSRCCRR